MQSLAYRTGPGQAIQWPPYLMLLIKRLLDAGYLQVQRSSGSVHIMGMQASPDYLFITPAGREFVDSLGLERME